MQPKNTPKTRRKYGSTGGPADFKAEVLKMLASGQAPACVANALGVSENLIYRWKNMNQVGVARMNCASKISSLKIGCASWRLSAKSLTGRRSC